MTILSLNKIKKRDRKANKKKIRKKGKKKGKRKTYFPSYPKTWTALAWFHGYVDNMPMASADPCITCPDIWQFVKLEFVIYLYSVANVLLKK